MGRWSRHFVGGVLNQDTTYSSSRLVTLFIPIQSKRTRASGSALSPRGLANPHGEALHREVASRHAIRVSLIILNGNSGLLQTCLSVLCDSGLIAAFSAWALASIVRFISII